MNDDVQDVDSTEPDGKLKPGRDYGRGRPKEGIGAPQKAVILKRLELNSWNLTKTAKELSMTRRQLEYLIQKHGWAAYNDVSLLAEKAEAIVMEKMEEFIALADSARVEAVNRIRDLIPNIKDARILLMIISDLTKYLNPDVEGQNLDGGLLQGLQSRLTQINITPKTKHDES